MLFKEEIIEKFNDFLSQFAIVLVFVRRPNLFRGPLYVLSGAVIIPSVPGTEISELRKRQRYAHVQSREREIVPLARHLLKYRREAKSEILLSVYSLSIRSLLQVFFVDSLVYKSSFLESETRR